MADMANMEQVQAAWETIQQVLKNNQAGERSPGTGNQEPGIKVIPVTYMNSTADLKAFCGERDGIVCTSSNAQRIFEWAYARGNKIFFFPDQHLGRNTAKKLNIPAEQMILWSPQKENGGVTPDEIRKARLILWDGHCPVHMEFKTRDIEHVRKFFPGCEVVVHPECEKEVVAMADASGSTDFIVKFVAARPPKSVTFVGTEVNLITRLQQMFPDRKIFKLQRSLCLTMYQINLANLLFHRRTSRSIRQRRLA